MPRNPQAGAALTSRTRVIFEWKFRGELFEGTVRQETHVTTAVNVNAGSYGLRLPWQCKLPLRAVALQVAIEHRKLVPGMPKSKLEQVKVHGLAIPKEITSQQETAFVLHAGRRQEVLKVAHVAGAVADRKKRDRASADTQRAPLPPPE